MTETLSNLLDQDIEEALTAATALRPSKQRQILLESLSHIRVRTIKAATLERLLALIQVLLSGAFDPLDETTSLQELEQILRIASKNASQEARSRAVTIVALLLARARRQWASLPPRLNEMFRAAHINASPRAKITLTAIEKRITDAKRRSSESARPRKQRFSTDVFDVRKAATNVRQDISGDWYHDPWGWPEVEWLGKRGAKSVIERLNQSDQGWTVPIDVEKKDGGVRPGLIMNPVDRTAFQCLADELSWEAAAHLPDWAHGWRLRRIKPRKGWYASSKKEWNRFSKRVTSLCAAYKFTAHLDIQSFFASVDTSQLISQLGRRYRNHAVLDRLETYFDAWHQRTNGLGIPQRFMASSILAQSVLKPLDSFLEGVIRKGASNAVVANRWMDDIWLHSDNESTLDDLFREVEFILQESRLSLNAKKSQIFQREDAARYAELVDVYEILEEEEGEVTLTELLKQSENVPQFWSNLRLSKLIRGGKFRWIDVPPEQFESASFLASRLVSVIRDTGNWRSLTDVYVDFAHRHASNETLSVAIWAEMFPQNAASEIKKVCELFLKNLSGAPPRLLTPLAALRLSEWDDTLDLVEVFSCSDDMLRLRGGAFAALGTRQDKRNVRGLLRDRGDAITEAFLADFGFKPPPPASRFRA